MGRHCGRPWCDSTRPSHKLQHGPLCHGPTRNNQPCQALTCRARHAAWTASAACRTRWYLHRKHQHHAQPFSAAGAKSAAATAAGAIAHWGTCSALHHVPLLRKAGSGECLQQHHGAHAGQVARPLAVASPCCLDRAGCAVPPQREARPGAPVRKQGPTGVGAAVRCHSQPDLLYMQCSRERDAAPPPSPPWRTAGSGKEGTVPVQRNNPPGTLLVAADVGLDDCSCLVPLLQAPPCLPCPPRCLDCADSPSCLLQLRPGAPGAPCCLHHDCSCCQALQLQPCLMSPGTRLQRARCRSQCQEPVMQSAQHQAVQHGQHATRPPGSILPHIAHGRSRCDGSADRAHASQCTGDGMAPCRTSAAAPASSTWPGSGLPRPRGASRRGSALERPADRLRRVGQSGGRGGGVKGQPLHREPALLWRGPCQLVLTLAKWTTVRGRTDPHREART